MTFPLTPLEFGERARFLYAERCAVVEGNNRLSYRDFFELCDRWAAALAALGVGPGSRVVIIAQNTLAHLASYYAVPALGAVIVPVNFRLSSDDFRYIIQHSGATVVCLQSDFIDAIEPWRQEFSTVRNFVILGGERQGWQAFDTLVTAVHPKPVPATIDENQLLSINYTSGTTARPKGVMLTHRSLYLNILSRLVHTHLNVGERYLWTLPMFHVNGWGFVWAITAMGGTHVCLPKAEPKRVFELVREEQISLLCAAPTVLVALANSPEALRTGVPRGVRVLTAGAPPSAATIQRVENDLGWPLTHVYGLTEVSPIVTVSEQHPEHAGLQGQALATLKAQQGVECLAAGQVRVVDEEGEPVPRDGISMGEVIVRGHAVMKGYFNDPKATEAAIRNGWFHTGDAAVVHPSGAIEIRDRWKDVIISGGENISSVEVEGVLFRHPEIHEVAVVGMPHDKWGECPHAFIVPRPGATLDSDSLRAFCREHLAHFKVPQAFHTLQELPKTATGKVQKYVLRGSKPNLSVQ